MSSRKQIGNTLTITTMDDPVSVEAQYAPNSNPTPSQIHTTWQDGDIYMRTRESDSSVWSSWHLIVGESGDETDYKFGISQQKVTSSASIPPSDIADADWADAPMAVTTVKPFLWSRVQKKVWNATSQNYDIESTRYIRLTGEDGYTVQAQYAPNNNPSASQIHTTWQEGDLYMRTKQSNETTWSSWHKIVGESGGETDYSFNISKEKTSASATTAPSNCYYGTWQDAPIAPTSTYPYLWMKIQKKDGNGNNVGDASYARVTGELGIDYEIRCAIDSIKIPKDTTSTSVTTTFKFYYKESGKNPVAYNAYYGIYYRIGTSYTRISSGSGNSASLSAYTVQSYTTAIVVFMFSESYNANDPMSQSFLAKLELPIYKDGDTGAAGARGKTGRFYYYAQEWTNSSSPLYIVTDAQAPYFLYKNNYWVFNPEENYPNGISMSAMGTPSSSSDDWEIMTNDFKYLITEAIFGNYAHFGSAIISGDYLISQYGYMLGFCNTRTPINDKTQYQNVDTDDILGEDNMYDPTKLIWDDSNEREIRSTTYTTISSASFVQNRYYAFEIDEETELSGNELLWTIVSQSGTVIANGTITSTATGMKRNCVIFKSTISTTCNLRVKIVNKNKIVVISHLYLRFAKFIPYLAMDLLAGKIVANNIIARGELHADSLYHTMVYGNSNDDRFTINDESIVNLGTKAVGTTVILPSPSACKGRVVELFNHATSFYATWVGASSTSAFSAAYGSGLGLRVVDQKPYNYIKFYCDGADWWILKAEG